MATSALFETGDIDIFVNLHNAAVQGAQSKYGRDFLMLNTAFKSTADGKPKDVKDSDFEVSKDGTYEVGVICPFKDYKDPKEEKLTGDAANKVGEANIKAKDKLHTLAYDIIKEYFRWFAGKDMKGKYLADGINKEDLVEFQVDQKTFKNVYQNNKIANPAPKNTGKDDKESGADEEHEKGKPPFIGYKVGYTMTMQVGGE